MGSYRSEKEIYDASKNLRNFKYLFKICIWNRNIIFIKLLSIALTFWIANKFEFRFYCMANIRKLEAKFSFTPRTLQIGFCISGNCNRFLNITQLLNKLSKHRRFN